MTKDELKKEAKKYAEQCYGWTNNDLALDVAEATYIASAEPREKRIAELEQKLVNTLEINNGYLEKCKQKIADLEETNRLLKEQLVLRYNLEDKIQLLEKENAELKSEKGCETCTKFDEVKLAQAKKYIRQLLDFIKAKENGDGRHPTPYFYKEYEQFLKEIEK